MARQRTGQKTAPALAGTLTPTARESLEQLQGHFQAMTSHLLRFVEEDARLSGEIDAAARYFFDGRDPLPHVHDEDELASAIGRMSEWFVFERCSRSYRERPIETFLAQLPEGPERHAAELASQSVMDTFAVRAVAPGAGLTVQSLSDGRIFEVFERAASHELVVGGVLIGRLYPLDPQFWTLSGVIGSMNDPRAAANFKREMAKLPPEEARLNSQRDYELAMMGGRRPRLGESEELVPQGDLEEHVRRLLEEAGIATDMTALRERVDRAESPLDVFDEIIESGTFVNEEHIEETLAALRQLWNTTPRAELNGRTPGEPYREVPPGPLEMRLLSEFAEDLRREGFDGRLEEGDAESHVALDARFRAWVTTPRADLDGMSPLELILAERAVIIKEESSADKLVDPFSSGSDQILCPCGSGKPLRDCCLRHDR